MNQELSGNLAPPMTNGELAFEAPWQGRVFGMASTLCTQGYYEWSEFQAELIRVIGDWDRNVDDADEYRYYDHFLKALENLLRAKGLISLAGLDERTDEFLARPHGHDH